jgi:hypothetical protein
MVAPGAARFSPSAAGTRFFLLPVHVAAYPFEEKDKAGADDDERNE